MPSILVETGFISNPDEERLLKTVAYQQRLATAIVSGVRRYFEQYPPPGTVFAANRDGPSHASAPVMLASAAAARPLPKKEEFLLHRVGKGQSLGWLAKKYGVTQQAIKAANSLKRTDLRIGETLKIPKS